MSMLRVTDDEELFEQIEQIAREEERPVSTIRLILLREAVQTRRGKPDAYLLTPKQAKENPELVKKFDEIADALPDKPVSKKIVVQAQNKKVTPKQQKLDRAVAAETGLCEHFQKKGQCMVKGCKHGR